MRLVAVIYVLLLGLVLVLGGSLFIEERPAAGHGYAHPDHPAMLIGGPGAERAAPVFLIGTLFGVLVFSLMIALILYGMRTRDPARSPLKPLLGVSVVYLIVLAGVLLGYRAYVGSDELRLFGSVPTATAWVFYGIWTVPAVYVAIYVFGFERYVWNEDDEREFRKILDRR